MSATDLDRYLTDEAVEKAARALWDEPGWEQATHEQRQHHREAAERALSAVLPDIIRQAKAEALEAARGPYRCCPHCADDLIHDVEKDDHTVPCQLCQNDEIRRAKAEAWDEGHLAGHEDARSVQPTYPQSTRNPYMNGGFDHE